MATKNEQIAFLHINASYLSHMLDDYIYKDQVQTGFYDNEILQVEKHKADIKWRKQHDKLFEKWIRTNPR